MSAEPLSATGGAGPIVPVTLINPQAQAQAQIAKTQTQVPGDAFANGARSQNAATSKTSEQNATELNSRQPARPEDATKAATNAANAISAEDKAIALDEAVETFKEYVDGLPSDLKFHVDHDANRTVFKIVNPVTREVVKQYPSDDFLHMVKRLKEITPSPKDSGFLVDDRF
ncbi:MAG: flagellar protein FlaG [Holophagaceae bacterium]|jgi:uncharacterized FlaG/YvyC family protein|nr:flagellar protein FlaG [Holophagaceae bacterium]